MKKVIILGGGKDGIHIADILAKEGHNITIIENNPARVREIQEKVDALIIDGDGASEELLKRAGVAKADLLIAVTDRDEINIMAAIVAKEYQVELKMVRIQNKQYAQSNALITPHKLGIDFLINPSEVVAQEIYNKIYYFQAAEAAEFAKGQVVFLSYYCTEDGPICGISLNELLDKGSHIPFIIMAITRNERIFIPKQGETIWAKDRISFVLEKKNISAMRELCGVQVDDAKKIFIYGASHVGKELAKRLISRKHSVRIIDRNAARCKMAAQELNKALVFCTDGTDTKTLKTEGIENSDVFISVTDDDQGNILASLLAKSFGVKKTITQVARPDLIGLASSLGLTSCVSPRLTTANAVLKYIRGGVVFRMVTPNQEEAEVSEFTIPKKSSVTNKKISSLSLPKDVKIGAVVRRSQVIIPSGDDQLMPNDHVIVFCLSEAASKLEKFFELK